MSDAFDDRRRGLEEEYFRRQDREAHEGEAEGNNVGVVAGCVNGVGASSVSLAGGSVTGVTGCVRLRLLRYQMSAARAAMMTAAMMRTRTRGFMVDIVCRTA